MPLTTPYSASSSIHPTISHSAHSPTLPLSKSIIPVGVTALRAVYRTIQSLMIAANRTECDDPDLPHPNYSEHSIILPRPDPHIPALYTLQLSNSLTLYSLNPSTSKKSGELFRARRLFIIYFLITYSSRRYPRSTRGQHSYLFRSGNHLQFRL